MTMNDERKFALIRDEEELQVCLKQIKEDRVLE